LIGLIRKINPQKMKNWSVSTVFNDLIQQKMKNMKILIVFNDFKKKKKNEEQRKRKMKEK